MHQLKQINLSKCADAHTSAPYFRLQIYNGYYNAPNSHVSLVSFHVSQVAK